MPGPMRRVFRVVFALVAFAAVASAAIGLFVAYELWTAQKKIDSANVTRLFAEKEIINAGAEFGANEVCVIPAEAFVIEWAKRMRPEYRVKEPIDPDSSLYWAILTFDHGEKSYRYLIVNRREVELAGDRSYCSHDLTLEVAANADSSIDSKRIATVVWPATIKDH